MLQVVDRKVLLEDPKPVGFEEALWHLKRQRIVRRKGWPEGHHITLLQDSIGKPNIRYVGDNGDRSEASTFTMDDVLAKDWEVVLSSNEEARLAWLRKILTGYQIIGSLVSEECVLRAVWESAVTDPYKRV